MVNSSKLKNKKTGIERKKGDLKNRLMPRRVKEKAISSTYTFTKLDFDNMELIKDKLLNKKVVLNNSHILRLSLMIAVEQSEDKLEEHSKKLTKLIAGRPKRD
ncbi:MAG: hypothetical protein JSS53_04795 [Proteobacteria bacterium]|nr:hypothetical protein [Pseudomonadota bacterium]